MEMDAEVAALSQLQLQLLSLVSDLRLLRARERTAREELHSSSKRWKEAEEEHRRKAQELRAEVAARDYAMRKLEFRIKRLENENELLEKNEKDLKETMEGLLQSRESFIQHYENSACSLQWTIQMKEKQIAVISEKLHSHLALFGTVEKEAAAVKQVLGDVECLISEKENVVSELKDKVQRISVLEKDFVEKISFLENKINGYQLELRNRAQIIYELKECLEVEKLNKKFQPQLEELRKAVLVKDEIIERLTSEKQSMLIELHNMEIALRKFQDIFSSIRPEGMKSFPPVSESQDIQDVVNNEQIESIPATQCGVHDEHTTVAVSDQSASTFNVECQQEINACRKQVQSPTLLKSSVLPSPESVTANTETVGCLDGCNIEMGNCSPMQETDDARNPIPEPGTHEP